MKVGSLFAGIGGFDLAARWVGWTTKWYSEIDPYACRVMEKHFGEAYNVGDITQWTPRPEDTVDVVCGGFPCQDISQARNTSPGIRGAESGKWGHMARVVGALRPNYVVIENTDALRYRGRGFGTVLTDLASLGYDAEWRTIRAAHLGAPHQRARLWVVAYPDRYCQSNVTLHVETPLMSDFHPRVRDWGNPPRGVRVVNGLPDRTHRTRVLGNSLVPQCAEYVFRMINAAALQEGADQ